MPNFIYPRTINITRAAYASTPTDGLNQTETPVLTNIAASIQLKRNSPRIAAGFQARSNAVDAMPIWRIFFKAAAGVVLKGDKITDDAGQTYIVESPYWNSLGYCVEAQDYTP